MLNTQQQYKRMLEKEFGNMTREEKKLNKYDLNAFKAKDPALYSMVPGFSAHKQNITRDPSNDKLQIAQIGDSIDLTLNDHNQTIKRHLRNDHRHSNSLLPRPDAVDQSTDIFSNEFQIGGRPRSLADKQNKLNMSPAAPSVPLLSPTHNNKSGGVGEG